MRLRRVAAASAAVLVIVVAAAAGLPFLFRGRIETALREAINRSVDARVAWDAIDLGLIRDFPDVSLRVQGLSVAGTGVFAGDTLVTMRELRVALGLGSVVGFLRANDPIVVREIGLVGPSMSLRVLADGTPNWAIVRPAPPTPSSATDSGVRVTLRELRIDRARIAMADAHAGVDARIVGLSGQMRGDLGDQRVTLATRVAADSVSARFGGVPWLSRARVSITADVDADLAAKKFTFANDTVRLNALTLAFGGTVVARDSTTDLDVTFSAPSTEFSHILSLVPAIYAKDFASIETAGSMSVAGSVRGVYSPSSFPAFDVRARVKDGMFRYPSLALPARDIQLDLAVRNPGGHIDSTIIALERFHVALAARTIDGRMTIRTPVSDPDVDLSLKGSVDLADVGRAVSVEGAKDLAGIVSADLAMRARLSDVDAKRYDRVAASGRLHAGGIRLQAAKPMGAVRVDTAAIAFTPRAAELTALSAMLGRTDVRATGAFDNVLGYLLRGEDLRGRGTVASRAIDLGDWISPEPTTEVVVIPDHIDFTLTAAADRVTYGPLTATDVQGVVRLANQRATLNGLQWKIFRGTMTANGFYETTAPRRPTFDVAMRMASLDIPAAFAGLATVRAIAPVARWAQGAMSGDVALRGSLDSVMTPLLASLTSEGSFITDRLGFEKMPILEKLADALSFEAIRNPTIGTQRGAFSMANGRVTVRPFTASVGGFGITVGGSHGIDQTLAYDVALAVPRGLLAGGAMDAVNKLVRQAGRTDADLAAGDVAQLRARVTGSVASPAVAVDFAGIATSVADAGKALVAQQVEQRVDAVKQTADSALEAARERARAEGAKLIAEAERQADTIRAAARGLAEAGKRAASARADSLAAKASGPVAQIAARAAADRVRREAEQQAERVVREADSRAEALVARAKQQAAALLPPGG
jgi:hypothetical protein